jgi:hypothetical protein
MLCSIGGFYWLSYTISLASAWSILCSCKSLGIQKIIEKGKSAQHPSEHIAKARTIKIIAVSAQTLIKQHKQEIVDALCSQNAEVSVLLAQPNSVFVRDVEESESDSRVGQISPEIEQTKNLLLEYLKDAASKAKKKTGMVQIGHYGTHLRCSLVLCDDKWGLLTLNLPPKRAVETVSFELTSTPEGLLIDCLNHFNRTWEWAKKMNQVQELKYKDGV